MNFTSSIHNHCTICDGKSTPEEMVEAAIAAGITDFGMSSHSYDPVYPFAMKMDEQTYAKTIRDLALAYGGQIRVFCGVEQDYLMSVQEPGLYDYIIGSVHCINAPDGTYFSIDEEPENVEEAVKAYYHGNALACVEDYYRLVLLQAETLHPQIIGHYDIITKTNNRDRIFDEEGREYKDLALSVLEAVAQTGSVFEVNTAAIQRGMGRPYPDLFLLKRLREMKVPVLLSVDCHDASRITAGIPEAVCMLQDLGFKEVVAYRRGSFQEEGLS